MAATVNLFLDQGSSFSSTITVRGTTGNPLDLSGYTAYSQMRKSYYSSTAYNFTASITGSTGQILLSMSATATAALTPGRYVYDVEIRNVNEVTRIVEGIVEVDPEVTKIP